MSTITWATVKTFRPGVFFAHGGGDRWVRSQGPNCTAPVARLMAARGPSTDLATLRGQYGREIRTSK